VLQAGVEDLFDPVQLRTPEFLRLVETHVHLVRTRIHVLPQVPDSGVHLTHTSVDIVIEIAQASIIDKNPNEAVSMVGADARAIVRICRSFTLYQA